MMHPQRVTRAVLLIAAACSAGAWGQAHSTDEAVQAAGSGAHFGSALCGFTSGQVADYKAKLRASMPDAKDFDYHWNYGWIQQERTLLQYQSLRAGDPQAYAARVKGDCNRLRFRIRNTRPVAPAPAPGP
ncbi:MAG: hypothetical protein EPN73_00565 [Paraburkholderia sp.]|uniref:hypothetical protein n=1 Tax=Paraburkholderia sp. TaxID=1926495 RepID=UPI00121E62EF|nr:hypothetical protein [Paraburkholderia sp.]TAL99079.1 MAG: hypothetical protein EPN73_00565 [Paraburkholderia sp.]